MGRALVRNPKLFLFDEPLSNLDAKLRVDMRTEIKKLHQRVGKTTVYVTPRPGGGDDARLAHCRHASAAAFSSSTCRSGSTTRPTNMFVAGFMGSPTMNFLPGYAWIARRHSALRRDRGQRRECRPAAGAHAARGA